ncbi:MAG TPA: histidine phosphatase family protein [Gaiellaceae bacterium]|nr:histidine phosphatase family protein [Gaiellaceae bacterium]
MARLVAMAVLAAVLAGCGGGDAAGEAGEPLGLVELVERLRGGGYVVYLRHGATDPADEDTQPIDVASCEGMRNLTEQGKRQSRELGNAVRALRIPFGDVLASAYCRTRQTAELAFGRYRRDGTLTGFPDAGDPSYETRVRATRALLARPPADGTNTVLVAHVKNLEAAAGVSLAEGEMVVFEPLGGTDSRVVGRVPPEVWPQLVRRLTRGP